jgi:rfaE bifunctional protein kinase chain/domain
MIEGGASVLVVGDIMLDEYWYGEVKRISPEAPVPILTVLKKTTGLGGAGNVARNIEAFGAHCGIIAAVGSDEAAIEIRKHVKKIGIADYLLAVPTVTTTVKTRLASMGQQLIRADREDFLTEDVSAEIARLAEAAIRQYQVVVLSDYAKGALRCCADIVAHALKKERVVIVDPKGANWTRYGGASLLTPNRSELAEVIGMWSSDQDLEERVRSLMASLDLKAVLLTRSEEGMTLFDDAGTLSIETNAKEVFDVSGAGDTVVAMVAFCLGKKMTLREAVVWANKAAGVVVGKFGTATCTLEEIGMSRQFK